MSTLLLNHFNGSDGATTFTDEVAGITWTRPDGVGELDTAVKHFGASSLLLSSVEVVSVDGSGFASPHEDNHDTEVFWRFSPGDSGGIDIQVLDASDNIAASVLFSDDSNAWTLQVFDSGGALIVNASGSAMINASTFYHAAIQRDVGAGTWALYFNGSRLTLQTAGDSRSFTKVRLKNESAVAVHFDEVRVFQGLVYSGATYTVPTAEFSTVALAVIDADEQDDTAAFTATVWEGFAGAAALSISAQANLAGAELAGDAAFTFSGEMEAAIQGLGGAAVLSLSMSGDLERLAPSSVNSEVVYTELAAEANTGEIFAEIVKTGLEIVGHVDA